LAYLTFALNWLDGGDEVFGYHFVNILLYSLSACLLLLTIFTLFQTPTLREKHSESVQSVALLTTALWVINPIQTQSVTLIVQRMTLLAAFFYIGGIYCYLKARLAGNRWQQGLLFCMCLTSWLLGMASKEMVVLLPLSLVLTEAIFFHDIAQFDTDHRFRLAETLNRLQQWQPALVHIDALLARHPRHPDYLNLKGTILMQRGNA
jgi:hypothetical protein